MAKKPFKNLRAHLNVETLESRVTPTCTSVSGFVYYDANNNGLFDAGETPIADSTIELRDMSDNVIGSTTTDANGFYTFDTDHSHPGTDTDLTKTVDLPTTATQTNYSLQGVLDQFDPSLGQLQSIDITYGGSITSKIDVENFSDQSDSDINGTVSGDLTLTAPNVTDTLSIAAPTGTPFHASVYDGTTDFDGTSGGTLGEHTVDGTKTVTLSGSDMDPYIGTGQVDLTTATVATSNATGGGNLDVRVRSTGISTVTVTYHYKAYDCIAPGDYKIIQTQQPDGYTDGLESKDGVVDPNSVGTDEIDVTLPDNGDLVNNDFGELKPTGISGHVWYDANNDGVRDPSEDPIPGTTITLDGPGGPLSMVTDAAGFYHFDNLQPGTYTVMETQPDGYLDGKDNAGTLGGTVVNDPAMDQIQDITLQASDISENNDFGEIKESSLAGHVWFDANNDGVRDPSEAPIPGTTITLTGFDDQGPVNASMTTDSSGAYKFEHLRPGTYALVETQPAGYADGQDVIGTPGGTTGNDVFSDINLDAGVDGVNNDFGEIKGTTPTPPVPLPKDVGPLGMLPAISKAQMTSIPTWSNVDPALRGQMAFVVGATITTTGHQLDLNGTMAGVQSLMTGTTQTGFVNQLWASDAHRALQVNNIYRSILSRNATSAEVQAAAQQLNTTNDPLAVMETLYASNEFQQQHAGTDALATALSEKILNETPGSASLQTIVQSMGNETLDQVVHDLLTSDAALANQVDNAYLETVRRHPTAAETTTWTAALQAGTTTLDAIAQRLLASQEFYQLTFNNIH